MKYCEMRWASWWNLFTNGATLARGIGPLKFFSCCCGGHVQTLAVHLPFHRKFCQICDFPWWCTRLCQRAGFTTTYARFLSFLGHFVPRKFSGMSLNSSITHLKLYIYGSAAKLWNFKHTLTKLKSLYCTNRHDLGTHIYFSLSECKNVILGEF